MNLVITERDKKLLGFLAAFFIVLVFFFLVFKPLGQKNSQIKRELRAAKELEAEFDDKASSAQDMTYQEEQTRKQLAGVLARFYPIQQSQGAEKMITTLLLNHNMSIQSLTVVMPETASRVQWYQYSENGRNSEITPGDSTEEKGDMLSLYTARVACVVEGDDQDLWSLVDDISDHYPAISITSAEWAMVEQSVVQMPQVTAPPVVEDGEEQEDDEALDEEGEVDEEEIWAPVPVTEAVKTNRLTISFEIYMCNQ